MKNSIIKSLLVLALTLCASVFVNAQVDNQNNKINYDRPYDKAGINVFETTKEDLVPYTGFQLKISGGFTQQFQALSHTNNADTVLKDNNLTTTAGDSVNINKLYPITNGFNLATANLILTAQLGDGIVVKLENYMSARHHNEFWVKGGYIQIDKLPFFGNPQWFADNFTVKLGQFENNYGDAHYYRTDNANGIYNPFVGENIMDAFNTEIGGEFYFKPDNGIIAMLGLSSGLLNSNIKVFTNPNDITDTLSRNPSIYGKIGYDKELNDDLRVRLTGSFYSNAGTSSNNLYSGDRAGSRYYLAGEQEYISGTTGLIAVGPTAQFTSGRLNPGFSSQVTSIMINPFVKFHGLEVFGTYEMATGNGSLSSATKTDTVDRSFNQLAVQGLYRFLEDEQAYVGVRYNTVAGRLFGYTDTEGDIDITRLQVAAGWFPTENLLLKIEYVKQNYNNFRTTDSRSELEFKGVMIEASVGF